MALSIDWDARIIFVPRIDMTLVQTTPVEIRELDLNQFRLELKDNEDSDHGMAYPDTHSHSAPVSVGGVTLARVVEIINNYTVTFEDGQYAVNLVGANSNVGDRVNVNQVSVRSANSAGLVTSAAIEFGEYGGAVTVNQSLPTSGTAYPIGTLRSPVGNIPDAVLIAQSRGFSTIKVLGNLLLDTGDVVENMIIVGEDPSITEITILSAADTRYAQFRNATLQGVLDGDCVIDNCVVKNLNYVSGRITNSWLEGVIALSSGAEAHILNCHDATIDDVDPPTIDMGGSGQNLAVRDYHGRISIINKSGASDEVIIDLSSGVVHLDSTLTAGTVRVRGVGNLIDESSGSTVYNELVESADIMEILKLTGNKIIREGDIITIYEADDITVWRQYDLSGGGRVRV